MILTSLYAKSIFKDHIFPCFQDKSPKIKKGQSWLNFKATAKDLEEMALVGFRCGLISRVIVIDIDTYKEIFMKSEESKRFRFYMRKHCSFWQKTQSGGEQYFFLIPEGRVIKSKNAFLPGIDIKAEGGYVCLYNNGPIHPDSNISNYEEFLNLLTPIQDLSSFAPAKKDTSSKSKPLYKEGSRNDAFNRDVFIANKYEDSKRLAESMWWAAKSGLSKEEALNTLYHKFKNFYSTEKDEETKEKLKNVENPASTKKFDIKEVRYISRLGFPANALSIFAALPMVGKTNIILKALVENYLIGDKRPFLYYTKENSISNVIVPRILEYGGSNNEKNNPMHIIDPLRFDDLKKYKEPESIPAKIVQPYLLKAASTGIYSALVLDPGSLFIADEDNKSFEKGLIPFLTALHPTTALICTAQLLKEIKGKELIHQVRGATDYTGMARKVYYVRKCKEENQRICVLLKDSYTGNPQIGFLCTKKSVNSDLNIAEIEGSSMEILADYGKPFSETGTSMGSASKKSEMNEKIEKIKNKYKSLLLKNDFILSVDFLKWIKDEFKVKERQTYNLFAKSGFISEKDILKRTKQYIVQTIKWEKQETPF